MRNLRGTAVLIGMLTAMLAGVQLITGVVAPQAVAAEKNCRVILHRAMYEGTENQPKGVTFAKPYGMVEADANPTEPTEDDPDGVIVAAHDNGLDRLTGGDSTSQIGNVTWEELRSFDHPFGKFRRTTSLINRAAEINSPIMINLHRAGEWTPALIDELYAASRNHPRPEVVYFGGAGTVELMHERHEDASTFHRFAGDADPARMTTVIDREGYELVALRGPHWVAEIVDDVRTTGVKVATTQIDSGEDVRRAQAAGINIIQGNRPRWIAEKACA